MATWNEISRGEALLYPLINMPSGEYYVSIELLKRRRRSANLSGLIGLVGGIFTRMSCNRLYDRSTIQLVMANKSLGLVNEANDEDALRLVCNSYLVDILGLIPCKEPSKHILHVKLLRRQPSSGIYIDCGTILRWSEKSTTVYINAASKLRKGLSLSAYLQQLSSENV